jgi:hypothetical protein
MKTASVALGLGLAAAEALWGQVLYFDTFQQFASGTSLTATNYAPLSGTYGTARTSVEAGTPVLTASNFLGGMRLFADCRAVPCESKYEGKFASAQRNQVLVADWLLWIASTNSGGGAFAVNILTTNAGPQYNPLIALADNGQMVVFTNSPAIDPGTPIGDWGQWAGTLMTNRLLLDYQGRAFSFSINGRLTARASMAPYFTNTLDAVRFDFMEAPPASSPAALGNCFAIDDVKVTEVPYLRAIEKAGPDIRIRFNTLCTRTYYLYKSEDLATGAWTFLTSGVAGADGMVTVSDPGAASLPRRFYRVAAFT